MSQQRVVFITGVSSGIGYETALAFIRNGDHVTGTARSVERLNKLRDAINQLPEPHGNFLPAAVEVNDPDSVQAAVNATLEQCGRLDIVIANAGIGHRGSIIDSTWDDVNQLVRTNVDGALHTVRAAVPAIRTNPGGHIVFISSIVYNMVRSLCSILRRQQSVSPQHQSLPAP